MKNLSLSDFQAKVDEVLVRHRSILDVLTKFQESSAKVNRAVAKSATYCGCIEIHTEKHDIPQDTTYSELKNFVGHHIEGALCDICREKIQQELANNLFYLTTICNLFEIDITEMMQKHYEQLNTLGKYGLL